MMAHGLRPRKQFQYEKLTYRDEIRLLRLHSKKQDSSRNFSLHHVRLSAEQRPPFRALSYTWDHGRARIDLPMNGYSVLKMRKNLSDALDTIRNDAVEGWIWIDAICIDQDSNTERDHQVRLMADIYKSANIVYVWLPSVGEKVEIDRVLTFLRLVAEDKGFTVDKSLEVGEAVGIIPQQSKRREDRRAKRRILENALCAFFNVNYWTRKWIIQEVIQARTVVLRSARTACPMPDLEFFFARLRGSDPARAMSIPWRRKLLDSPAARLAVQRLENTISPQPGKLHELIARYAANKCGDPADNVYALYSLIGEHRESLQIDYAASPGERFCQVMHFVHREEQLAMEHVPQFVQLLGNLLNVQQCDSTMMWAPPAPTLLLHAHMHDIEALPESAVSLRLRNFMEHMEPMQAYKLPVDISSYHKVEAVQPEASYRVGRDDMVYFGVKKRKLVGFASCGLEAGDEILHIPDTSLVFVVRTKSSSFYRIIGRGHIFPSDQSNDDTLTWTSWLSQTPPLDESEKVISMGIEYADLFDLIFLGTDPTFGNAEEGVKRLEPGTDQLTDSEGYLSDASYTFDPSVHSRSKRSLLSRFLHAGSDRSVKVRSPVVEATSYEEWVDDLEWSGSGHTRQSIWKRLSTFRNRRFNQSTSDKVKRPPRRSDSRISTSASSYNSDMTAYSAMTRDSRR